MLIVKLQWDGVFPKVQILLLLAAFSLLLWLLEILSNQQAGSTLTCAPESTKNRCLQNDPMCKGVGGCFGWCSSKFNMGGF